MEKHSYADLERSKESPDNTDPLGHLNLLLESGFLVGKIRATGPANINPTSIIEPLPAPGAKPPSSSYEANPKPEAEVPKQENRTEAEAPKHNKKPRPEEDDGLSIISSPAKWFEPKNMGNPLNPIYW